ncbi:MAG: hypothetical protein J5711_01190 [Bacteroidales bacterium]|nr:hypothetical protein [Bacteroidales bacterium]
MRHKVFSIIGTLLLLSSLLLCGCNNTGSNKYESVLDSVSQTNTTSMDDALLEQIKTIQQELDDLELQHLEGKVSERDYQLNKAVNERTIELLLEKL